MYKKCVTLLLLSSCLILTGCGDSHDKVMRDSISEMKRLVTVLEGIKSEADAKAAKGKIEGIAKRMKAIEKRMEKLGDPSPEIEARLKEKYEGQMKELMPKLMAAMFSAKSPEIAKILESSMPQGL